jgi:hypothetical protein
MSRYKTIYTEVEVEVDLEEFDTEDLIEELESRGRMIGDQRVTPMSGAGVLLDKIHQKRRTGQDYQNELDELIWCGLGKII